MKLIRLKADFGGLNGRELTLNSGLNVIEAPNGSGKSSWCRFIRAMLYGMNGMERSKGGSLPDKLHYVPWDGSRMGGQMDIEWRGRQLTLSRRAENFGKPLGTCSVTLSGTAQRLPELEGGSVGEALLGVGESVFLRSACIGGDMAVDSDDELERRILSLVSTGEEESSASEAAERLLKRKRQLNRRGGGEIQELSAHLRQLQADLRGIESAQKEAERLREAKRQKERELADWKTELLRHERDMFSAISEEYRKSLAYYEKKKRELETLRGRLSAVSREEIEAVREAGLALNDAERKHRAELLRLSRKTPKRWIPLGASALLLALSLLLISRPYLSVAFLGGALVFAVLSVIRLLSRKNEASERLRRCEREIRQRAGELDEAQRRLGLSEDEDDGGLYRLEEEYTALERLERECEAAKRSADLLGRQKKEIPAVAGVCTTERSEAENGLRAAETERNALEKQLAQSEGRAALLGDPLLLSTEECRTRDELARKEREYEAIDMALEGILDSEREFHSLFSPLLSRKTGELLAAMSGGVYSRILFDRDLKILVEQNGDGYHMDYFSEGTKNLIYLALRLALCELILPQEEPCPLILDDVLRSFDDSRAKQALRLLRENAKKRQVILFTCRHREIELLSELEEEDDAICNDTSAHGKAM